MSDMVENVGVAVGIGSQAHSVQKLFPLPVSDAAILNLVGGRRREISNNVGSVNAKSVLVENVFFLGGGGIQKLKLRVISSRSKVFAAAILDFR